MAEDHSGFKALGAVDMNSNKINNVTDPTAAQDAATKAYVDAAGFTSRARVYRSSVQAIADSTLTKVGWNAESYDTDNEFSTVNYRFTATNAGYYQIISQVRILSMAANTDAEIVIKKNGVIIALSSSYQAVSGSLVPRIMDLVYLAAGDYVEIWIEQYSGSSKNIREASPYSFMTIHRLS